MLNLILRQDIPKLIEGVEKLSERLGIDPKLLKYVWWAFVLLLLLRLLTWLKKLLWEEYAKPLRATPEEKRRLARRQMFAGFVEGKIRDINGKEEWRDHRFTELEAEVEAEGERQAFTLIPFIKRTRSGLRREKSLSRAIEQSRERLIQLEGEPGSGKSVALRFVARQLAGRASRSRSLRRPIPLYLNLKEINRRPDVAVDRNLIEGFVKQSLTRTNDRDIEKFLEDEFARGMEAGTWIFLFDSFDEIPEVLSSTEADATIRGYADAISDFLAGFNRCRGVVASRHFRGPGQSRWPRFRILPLSEERRLRLIKRALLPAEVEQQVKAQLETAGPEARGMFSNPMLLGLLCEHMKGGNPFPENIHTVMASYLDHRLTRDSERVARRYGVAPSDVRAAAEAAAFCMADDVGLGLSPAREQLKSAMRREAAWDDLDIDLLLDALAYIKLARSEDSDGLRDFTFSHRRFQEYFATCVVLREPGRVPPRALLADARWRETAVVMFQSQPSAVLAPLVSESRAIVGEITEGVPEGADEGEWPDEEAADTEAPPDHFRWPRGALHFLSLLQDGLGRRLHELPDDIRERIGTLLIFVSRTALQPERKSGLEVAGVTPSHVLLTLLRDAFGGQSQLLKNVAYRQAGRLGEIPDDIADSIRSALLWLATNGRLRRERLATKAHLARLQNPGGFISSVRLLLVVPHVDLILHLLAFAEVTALATGGFTLRGGLPIYVSSSLLAFLFFSYFSLRWSSFLKTLLMLTEPLTFVMGLRLLAGGLVLLISVMLAVRIGPDETDYVFPAIISHTVLWAYLVLWTPSALLAARAGQCTSVFWWPVMPLAPLFLMLRNAPILLRRLWRLKSGLSDLSFLASCGFLILVILAGRTPYKYDDDVLLLLTLSPFVIMFALAVLARLRDNLRWHRAKAGYLRPLAGPAFLNEFWRYATGPFRLRLVRTIRALGSLGATREAEEAVEELVLLIESPLEAETRGAFPILRKKLGTLILMDTYDAEILDELTLLLEQVRAGRVDRARPAEATAAPAGTLA